MDPSLQSVAWEAPEHYHIEKRSDWFWALWIIVITASFASFFLGNFLLGILIVIAGATMALLANRKPPVIPFAVTTRGVRVGDAFYPYASLESYHIETENSNEPLLLIKSQKLFMHLIVIPLPDDYIEDVESIIEQRLTPEDLEEPLSHKILELFGF